MMTVQHKRPFADKRRSTSATRSHIAPARSVASGAVVQHSVSCPCGGSCPQCKAKSGPKPDEAGLEEGASAIEPNGDSLGGRGERLGDTAANHIVFRAGHYAFSPVQSEESLEKKARANVSDASMRMSTTFAGSRPTFKNWGGGTLCQSPMFAVTAQVSVPPAMANGDLTVGFMQALVGATGPKGRYWDANDAPYMTAFAPYARLPLKDGDSAESPFYGPEAQKVVDSPTITVSMADQPHGSLGWVTPDKKGRLQQVVGDQQFVTWLVVKSESTGDIDPLHYFSWRIGWFAAVDEFMAEGIPFDIGDITDGGEGSGPLKPIRRGPIANDSVQTTKWEPWTG